MSKSAAPFRTPKLFDYFPSLSLKVDAKNGGARRDRTDDLMLAKHALSQLSYGPGYRDKALVALRWWAWEGSNFRPHAYQARALTN